MQKIVKKLLYISVVGLSLVSYGELRAMAEHPSSGSFDHLEGGRVRMVEKLDSLLEDIHKAPAINEMVGCSKFMVFMAAYWKTLVPKLSAEVQNEGNQLLENHWLKQGVIPKMKLHHFCNSVLRELLSIT